MRVSDKQPQRLGLGKVDPSSREARAGAFLREALDVPELSDGEIAEIRVRLANSASVRRPRRLLMPAFAAFGVLFVAGGVLAALGTFHRHTTAPSPVASTAKPAAVSHSRAEIRGSEPEPVAALPTEVALPVEASAPHEPARRLTAARPTARPSTRQAIGGRNWAVASAPGDSRAVASEPSPIPSPSPVAALAPVGARVTRPAPAAVVPTPSVAPAPVSPTRTDVAPPSAAGAEARSLAAALERWRRQGEAEAALGLLEEHERRFPRGLLRVESRVARAEILLALGRTSPALGVLDSLDVSGLPRARELEVLRGELRARAGRCTEARSDLNAALRRNAADELAGRAERALQLCP